MTIDIEERYKLIFEEHHYASTFRMKIFTGWCVIYAALAASFVWVYKTSKPLSWVVSAVGIVITVLIWAGDIRNRSALRSSKDVGQAIEEDSRAEIPPEQRFFAQIKAQGFWEKLLTHSRMIDIYSICVILGLVIATIYLFLTEGKLPT